MALSRKIDNFEEDVFFASHVFIGEHVVLQRSHIRREGVMSKKLEPQIQQFCGHNCKGISWRVSEWGGHFRVELFFQLAF